MTKMKYLYFGITLPSWFNITKVLFTYDIITNKNIGVDRESNTKKYPKLKFGKTEA